MDAITDGASADRYGLSRFGAVDTTGQPTLDPEEDVAAIFPDVGLRLGDNAATSAGTLHITSTRIIWVSKREPKGYFVNFPAITMHAVSQEPEPCIYAQLDASDVEDEEDDDEETYPEIRLIPQDTGKLQVIFETLCECAALNPDSEEDDSEDEGFYYNEEEALNGIGADGRAAMLDHLDSLLDDTDAHDLDELAGEDPERFEDPVEDEEDGHQDNHAAPASSS